MDTLNFQQQKILGVRVDKVTRGETIDIIEKRINQEDGKSPLHLVTAYSEFFVTAQKDKDFREILEKADLVVADGVGPLGAMDYLGRIGDSDSVAGKFFKGMATGWRILSGKVGQPVSGVWLFSKLTEMTKIEGWKLFLLGGFGETSEKLARELKQRYPKLMIEYDRGVQELDIENMDYDSVIDKINKYQPDILFVAYGPVKQEKWIARNKSSLRVKVAIGVGGTFDEMLNPRMATPGIMEKMGLKWLWRLILEPKRFKRIFNAIFVFPLLVFKEALQKS